MLTCRDNGRFSYAVTPVVDGYEAVSKLDPGAALAKPVAERVAPIAPLPQHRTITGHHRHGEEIREFYVCFYEPPYWPTPRRVEMCSAQPRTG